MAFPRNPFALSLLRLLLLAPLLMAFQCEDEIDPLEDGLFETGLLGTWEIADETINGISDMLPKCCRFLEFYPDTTADDLKGEFRFEDDFGIYDGVFTLEPETQTLIFQREDRTPVSYGYTLNDARDYLVFTFTENDAVFEQGWRRVN